ncbi:MG2 domain-containing protein [Chitinophagaceae bacterium LWZ2-11]
MKKIIRFLVVFLTLLFSIQLLFAQNEPANKNQIKLFFEKVYLHMDRSYYVAGDDIWYKAYLVNGQSNYPTFTSNNLYVELISPSSTIINREVIRLEKGLGNGDFKLPDTLSEGTYRIRAYTNWMKNFGDDFIFDQQIKIAGKSGIVQNTPTKKNTTVKDYRLLFYPEGGSLIAGVPSVVAFKAEDATGKGVNVQGNILNSKGKSITSFKSTNAGFGKITFTPEADESYDVKAQLSNGVALSSDFPMAQEKGFQMTVSNIDTDYLQAGIAANKATLSSFPNSLLHIKVRHGGKLFYEDSVQLNTDRANIKIPKSELPQGIAVITLYDDKMRPNCERLFFVDKAAASLSLQLNKLTFNRQENAVINLATNDPAGNPLKGNLSMAVVDAGIVPATQTAIINYLLLQSELKGTIENPDKYFDKNNPERLQQLDLLLLTQGWRDFVWLKLTHEQLSIKYLPEAGITISGRVRRSFTDKPLSNMNVTLFAPQAHGTKLFSVRTDTAGRYYLDGINITGTQRIKLVSKDNRGEKGGYLLLDPLFTNQLSVSPVIPFERPDSNNAFKQFATKSTERVNEFEKLKNAEYNELPGVTVTSGSKVQVTRDDVLMRFGYADSVFTVDPRDYKDYGTLMNYLSHKMPGAYTDVDTNGLYFIAAGKKVSPRFFIENKEDVFGRMDYYTLTMDNISKVTIKHLLSAMNPGQDVYQIYLTLKPGANVGDANTPESISTEVVGYYEARSFYIPQPKQISDKNYLTTLLWVPNIETKQTGPTRITIDNKKQQSKWKVIVQGITENGVPVAGVVSYEVR